MNASERKVAELDARIAAGESVYCGMCRRGSHSECKALRGATRVFAGLPARGEENCACSCDPTQPVVPGQNYAREWGGP